MWKKKRTPSAAPISLQDQLARMRSDWDARAIDNARYFVNTASKTWTDEEFYRNGVQEVEEQILTDMTNICQGKPPGEMRVLEIGCGAGRMTRALAALFGEVHAVDVSGEMVRLAQQAVKPYPKAFVYRNNGMDLSVIPVDRFDFALSYLVFQHIPSREVIENYVREVYRLLQPGALFKFQVQGGIDTENADPPDTWVGVPFTQEQVEAMAVRTGFECRHFAGIGEQYFWSWFFKPASAPVRQTT